MMNKNRITIFFLAASLAFASCSKKELKEPRDGEDLTRKEWAISRNSGIVSADLNGKKWIHTAVVASSYYHEHTFDLSIYNCFDDLLADILTISYVDKNKKDNPIHSIKYKSLKNPAQPTLGIATFSNSDGDQHNSGYAVWDDSTETSWVNLESYDPVTRHAKGTFKITFVHESGKALAHLTDTIRITNGTFDVIVRELSEK